ncbi:MAG: hypothetical protein JWN76_799 [Chitinophagaceae bacterium]|nr:hypothetical protein [Chitinophagaceae bacterium]
MSEHDLTKHTKKIYTSLKEKEKPWKHRLLDIGIEILIIVFALSLTLLLERWREHSHDRKKEKTFLTGLKRDLINDLTQEQQDSAAYEKITAGWIYFRSVGSGEKKLEGDSLGKYYNTLVNTVELIPNNSRFEALKSSGSIDVIEDDSLKAKILDLYQYHFKTLLTATSAFNYTKTNTILPWLQDHLILGKDGTNNVAELLAMPKLQNILLGAGPRSGTGEIIERYHFVMQETRDIIKMIDEQYEK